MRCWWRSYTNNKSDVCGSGQNYKNHHFFFFYFVVYISIPIEHERVRSRSSLVVHAWPIFSGSGRLVGCGQVAVLLVLLVSSTTSPSSSSRFDDGISITRGHHPSIHPSTYGFLRDPFSSHTTRRWMRDASGVFLIVCSAVTTKKQHWPASARTLF